MELIEKKKEFRYKCFKCKGHKYGVAFRFRQSEICWYCFKCACKVTKERLREWERNK